jgi:hypothetical protein
MKSSYLIQRLLRPFKTENKFTELANAFSFGGGYKNGGLSDEAMVLLKDIFRFDYMGAAEFEWGAVPKSLSFLFENAQKGDVVAARIPVPYKYKAWDEKIEKRGISPVWYICHKDHELEVINRINNFAVGKGEHTKERVKLDSAMGGDQYSKDNIGWLEIDNHYMFFTDQEAFNKMIQLLGIKEG